MTDRDYQPRGDVFEVQEQMNLQTYSLDSSDNGEEKRLHVIPPVVLAPGKYTIMLRKSLIATDGRTVDAVSCRVEEDVIYIDPVYNATGQPGY